MASIKYTPAEKGKLNCTETHDLSFIFNKNGKTIAIKDIVIYKTKDNINSWIKYGELKLKYSSKQYRPTKEQFIKVFHLLCKYKYLSDKFYYPKNEVEKYSESIKDEQILEFLGYYYKPGDEKDKQDKKIIWNKTVYLFVHFIEQLTHYHFIPEMINKYKFFVNRFEIVDRKTKKHLKFKEHQLVDNLKKVYNTSKYSGEEKTLIMIILSVLINWNIEITYK